MQPFVLSLELDSPMVSLGRHRSSLSAFLLILQGDHRTHVLLAAVAFLDSWAYMIYNAIEDDIPDVDGTIPPIPQKGQCGASSYCNPIEAKFGIKTDVFSIASDPKNKNWIQGAPVVYLNNEAPMHARFLDAIACAVRSCCDQANIRFAAIVKENDPQPSDNTAFQPETTITPTATAVLAHENELCSRNLVLSAFTMMRQHESNMQGHGKSDGQHLIVSAMDAFLENGDDTGDGGFTDSQIQSLLSVCNSAVENPLLLHHAGPTYHMVSNAAVLLCHLLNGMYLMKSKNQFGPMEATMFEEVLDTFVAVRKLLTIHRRKLPVKLRCHGIPRPSLDGVDDDQPFIDLGETLLCPCRGCQGFVLMACSPCVAAERARSASSRLDVAAAQETEAAELGEVSSGAVELRAEFDLDDDALLSMISDLIAS